MNRVGRLLPRCEGDSNERRLCHNDPIAQNVIGLRRTVLIDWEYAAIGDPLFDLAVVARHHRLPRRAMSRLMIAYFGDADLVPWKRLDDFAAVYDVVHRLWTLHVNKLYRSAHATPARS
jgi:thiamine kinase